MRIFNRAQIVALSCFCALFANAAEQSERGYFRYPAVHNETVVFTAEGDLWRGSIEGGVAQRLTTHPATEAFAAI